MQFGTLEVEIPEGLDRDKPCADCASNHAPLWVDGQPQCMEHAGSRLQADPEALGQVVWTILDMESRVTRLERNAPPATV